MENLMERGLRMGARALVEGAGGEAVYRRGESRVVIHPVRREPEYLIDSAADGVRISHLDQDWEIVADELILNGRLAEPARGDLIEFADGTVYQVLPRTGEECFRPIGKPAVMYRVQTKQTT